MKDENRCTAVEGTGKKKTRCTRSATESGAAKGLCAMHYQRTKRTGSTEVGLERVRDAVQISFTLPAGDLSEIDRIAGATQASRGSVLRGAIASFLKGSK